MKLLYCTSCHDILAPFRMNGAIRYCYCGRTGAGWRNMHAGELAFHGDPNAAYIIGLSNRGLLLPADAQWSADHVQSLIDRAKPDTNFRRWRTLAWRLRPDQHEKVEWR